MALLDITLNRQYGQVQVSNNLLVTAVGAYAIANICGVSFTETNHSYTPKINKWCYGGLVIMLAGIILPLAIDDLHAVCFIAAAIGAIIALCTFIAYKRKKPWSYTNYYIHFALSNGTNISLNSVSKDIIVDLGEEVAKVIQSRGQYSFSRSFDLPTIKVENNNIIQNYTTVDQSQTFSPNVGGNFNYVGSGNTGNVNMGSGNTTYQQPYQPYRPQQ